MRDGDQARSAATAHRPVRVGIVGEFNSGKSSVANLLLRQPLLEPSIEHSRMPPLHISLVPEDGPGPGGGATAQASEPGADCPRTGQTITATATCEALSGVVLTEISVSENGRLSAEAACELDTVDFIVWCTMGQRAWCLSEIEIVGGIRRDQLENSIIAITRADYLDTAALENVVQRVTEMTRDLFPVTAVVNASSSAIGAASDDNAWAESGGRQLHDALLRSVDAIRQREAARELAEDAAPSPAPAHELKPVASPEQPGSVVAELLADADALATAWFDEVARVQEKFAGSTRIGKGQLHAEIATRLTAVIERLPADDDGSFRLAGTFRRAQEHLARDSADDMIAFDLAIELRDRFAPSPV